MSDETLNLIDKMHLIDHKVSNWQPNEINDVPFNILHKLSRIASEREFMKKKTDKFNSLSTREYEVFELVLRGMNNPQIAMKLNISRSTVEQHRKNIKKKLRFQNVAEMFRYGYAFNLI